MKYRIKIDSGIPYYIDICVYNKCNIGSPECKKCPDYKYGKIVRREVVTCTEIIEHGIMVCNNKCEKIKKILSDD